MAPASPVELNPAEPLRVAARRVVAARREDLDGIAPGAVGSSDPEALHDVRVAVRRLTTALDVFADGLDEEARRRRGARCGETPSRSAAPATSTCRSRSCGGSARALARATSPASRTSSRCSRASGRRPRPSCSPPSPRSPIPSCAQRSTRSWRSEGKPRQGSPPGDEAGRSGAPHRAAAGLRSARVRRGGARSRQRARAARSAHRRKAAALHARGPRQRLGPAATVVEDEARALHDLLGEVHDCDVLVPRLERELALLTAAVALALAALAEGHLGATPRLLPVVPGWLSGTASVSHRRCRGAASGAVRAVPGALGCAARRWRAERR